MPLQPVRDIGEYKKIKESLRKRFEAERTGNNSVLTKELQRRNDQFDLLSEQPFYQPSKQASRQKASKLI
mgnify:CR=1 FL=1